MSVPLWLVISLAAWLFAGTVHLITQDGEAGCVLYPIALIVTLAAYIAHTWGWL